MAKITIVLAVPYVGFKKEVEATVFGDWAAHGVVMWEDDPRRGVAANDPDTSAVSDTHFSVSHVPSGRTLVKDTGYLTKACAEEIAELLGALGPVPMSRPVAARPAELGIAAAEYKRKAFQIVDEVKARHRGGAS